MSDAALAKPHSFLRHAKVVGVLTLASRIFGLVRDMASAHFLGTGLVASAFTVAFTVPNLFRKLFGEGALSVAFIPLFSKALREETPGSSDAHRFASAGVNLLVLMLLAITVVGEAFVLGWLLLANRGVLRDLRPDHALALKLTAIMLPYVIMICAAAFLAGVLQVHKRFAAAAAAPILLNLCHISVLVIGAGIIGIQAGVIDPALQERLVYWLACAVLVAGVLQLLALWPDLHSVGFRFSLRAGVFTPATKQMLRLTVPVAIGAGVVQLSVLLDRGLSMVLMQGVDDAGNLVTHFTLFGQTIRYPLEAGAPARLAIAQVMYLFPLGIFATALATAIFPSLSADALDADRTRFRASLRQGIEAALWEGIPASVGLALVAVPAVRLLFQHGQMTPRDAELIAWSLVFYAGGIWAFSLLQIISRAFYALHDTKTPLWMSVVNLVVNVAVEIPMIWWLGEAGMAVGTLAAFSVQAIWMLWILDRRVGGLELRLVAPSIGRMLMATAIMSAACIGVMKSPVYPVGGNRLGWAIQCALVVGVGAIVYLALCRVLGVTIMRQILGKRRR